MEENFSIKYKDHFKLYVQIKDKIKFESVLNANGVLFYSDINEQTSLIEGIRYFLLDEDRKLIDAIVKSNGIIASTETISLKYIGETKKLVRFSLIIIFGMALIIIIAILIVG